jgi:2-C-methyl-D-erythritol 2,4-cyclodiphosphate synthase
LKHISPYRTGIGFDAHLLKKGRPLILGGVNIPCSYGLIGHSDADVLVHSIIDALLGAMAMPDIGTIFPDTDPKYRNSCSIELLRTVFKLIERSGWQVAQIDSVLITDLPRLTPFADAIRKNVATQLKIAPTFIGLKAKTTEGTRIALVRKSIAALSIALLVPKGR